MAFYFTKTHILLYCWQRSFSFWRRPPSNHGDSLWLHWRGLGRFV